MIGPSALPPQYRDLADESGPVMLLEALEMYGLEETPGPDTTSEIEAWADELGLADGWLHDMMSDDATPWCGTFLAVVAQRSGYTWPADFYRAASWAKWGALIDGPPELGDVLVFRRPGGAHVGLYVGEDHYAYHVLGGNQSDAVNIARIAQQRLRHAVTPFGAQSGHIRRIYRSDGGQPITERLA